MIIFPNYKKQTQEIQALQQNPTNEIMCSPDEADSLSFMIKDLSKKALINQINKTFENNNKASIGKNFDIYA